MFGLKAQFKRLKDRGVPADALRRQRVRLEMHMAKHPMPGPMRMPSLYIAAKPFMAGFVVLILLSSTGGVVMAAQASLPGETLYAVKAASEEVRARLALSPDAEFRYRSKLAEKRLQEAEELYGLGPEPEAQRDRRIAIALRRYEGHVERLSGIVDRFEERERPKDPERAIEAMTKVLVIHADLLDSATTTDEETDALVSAYAEGVIGLETKFLERFENEDERPEGFENHRKRIDAHMRKLKERVRRAESYRMRMDDKDEVDEDREDDRWPKAWSVRSWEAPDGEVQGISDEGDRDDGRRERDHEERDDDERDGFLFPMPLVPESEYVR